MYSPVGLSAYEGMALQGFGTSTMQQVQELQKALSAGYGRDHNNLSGGNALRVESLEESLKVLTYTDRHLKLWPKIYKSPAYSTVEEYNELTAYGDDNFGPWIREGQLPLANDSTYNRRTRLIKFMGTTREVTHPAALVHPAHGDLFALENQNGIMWLMRQVEYYLFKGNASLAFSGESEQWDGLDNLIDPTFYIDLEGNSLQEADFEEISNMLAEDGYAFPTDIFAGYRPISDFIKTLYPRHRVQLPAPVNGRVGQSVSTITTQAGDLTINSDIFLKRPPTAPDAVRGPANLVPTAPAGFNTATIQLDSAVLTTGEFDKSQGSDDARYAYKVSACNQYGESVASKGVLSELMTGDNAVAGRAFQFQIQNAASITTPPEYFRIYRTVALKASTTQADVDKLPNSAYSLIMEISAASQSASGLTPTTVAYDLNHIMPFTEIAYVGELTPQVLTFRQLAPLMKVDLAVLAPAYRWMILLYGAPLLFAPRKWARLINIGRLGA